MTLPARIQMTNFVNRQPIIAKHAIFDRLLQFIRWPTLNIFVIILIVYKIFKEKFIVAQLLLTYTANILTD
jgi:hypothetical protein